MVCDAWPVRRQTTVSFLAAEHCHCFVAGTYFPSISVVTVSETDTET